MNAYVRNKLAKRQADNAVRNDALSILEELRQEAASGPEDAALIERNRRLINGTIDDSRTAPYNTVKGSQVRGLGIDEEFKADSDVKLHTVYGKTNDPVLLPSAEQYGLLDTGVKTEYLSKPTEERLFREYAGIKGNRRLPEYRERELRTKFNQIMGEYYGQQALKLSGSRAPDDYQRSYNVYKNPRYRNHENSTLGTDRIIETNKTPMLPDVGPMAGDYRHVNSEGRLTVGDYQVAKQFGPGNTPIKIQLVKEGNWPIEKEQQFASRLQDTVQRSGVTDIDDAMKIMSDNGLLPELVQGSFKGQEKNPYDTMRAGKMTSSADHMGQWNTKITGTGRRDGINAGQQAYEHVLFGLKNIDALSKPGGMVPAGFVNVDTQSAREYLAKKAHNAELADVIDFGPPTDNRPDGDGSVYINMPIDEVLEAGIGVNPARRNPAINQLFSHPGR